MFTNALKRGYGPTLLLRIAEAGPDAGGPILEILMEDQLRRYTELAVRQAQLMQRAIDIGTREAAEEMMAEVAALQADGATATPGPSRIR